MAYDKEKIFEDSKKIIVDKELIFMSELMSYIPCDTSTFYIWFPDKSDKLETLKRLIQLNKTDLKRRLRVKMEKDGKSADNIVLYKLAGTKEERDIINGIDRDVDVKPIAQEIIITHVTKSKDEIEND